VVKFRLNRDFGGLADGTTLTFTAAGDRHSRGPPGRTGAAEVLATDAHGRPALLLRPIGQGSLVLCTYPVEHMAAQTPRVNPDDTVTLYDALARHAGVRRLVTAHDPRVACDTLIRDDGALFAVLASHTTEQLTVKPALHCGGELTSLGGEEAAEDVELGPFGITVLTLTRSAPQAKPRPMQPPAGSPAHPRPPSLIGARVLPPRDRQEILTGRTLVDYESHAVSGCCRLSGDVNHGRAVAA
jgi:hypothetical protein